MQRVFRAAKFCTKTDDKDIAPSPIVAQLFGRLMDALITVQAERDGNEARERWNRWLTMADTRRDEWRAAVWRAKREKEWADWTDERRKDYAKLLLHPFVVSQSMLDRFTLEVGTKTRRKSKKRSD
jgi:hypothetical protein